jgi:membrane peptidoglycan carboxypeptidase
MRLAVALEKQVSQHEILKRYLNSAYYGHRAYGIFAAAQVFFSKNPRDLTLPESALLAGLVKAPSAYDPASRDTEAATERRNWVIDRMAALGSISAAQADEARQTPISLKLTDPPNDCVSVDRKFNDWGFFCDYLKTWWQSQPAFGGSGRERLERLRRGGYRIVTSIDPKMQASAQDHIVDKERKDSRFALGQVLIEPGSGRVKAMAVNRTYSLNQSRNGKHSDPAKRKKFKGNFPNTVNPLLGGGDMPGYQAGSTFKVFTLLAALDRGMPLSTAFNSPQKYRSKYLTSPDDRSACGNHWCPQNASGSMTGRQTMWSGFGKSVNTYFVQLEQRVGAERAVRMAERLGLRWRTPIDQEMASPERANGWGAFTLGVSDATPLEMANVFATLAADGRHCEPLPVLSIKGPSGTEVQYRGRDVAAPRCKQVLSTDVARAATDAARCVTGYGAAKGGCGGWGTSEMVYSIMKRPVAGKSGTTDSTRAAWFCGFTPQLAAAAFIADPDNPLHRVGTGNATKPKLAVAQTLRDALKGEPEVKFTPPSKAMLR